MFEALINLWLCNGFQVIPSEFGTPLPWYFPVTDVVQALLSKQEKRATNGGIVGSTSTESDASSSMVMEDADRARGRYRCFSFVTSSVYPVLSSYRNAIVFFWMYQCCSLVVGRNVNSGVYSMLNLP